MIDGIPGSYMGIIREIVAEMRAGDAKYGPFECEMQGVNQIQVETLELRLELERREKCPIRTQ